MDNKIRKNRAKCKLCEEIIESKHSHDYVTCKCGEISIDGGPSTGDGGSCWRGRAKDYRNFLSIDNEGRVIGVTHIEDEPIKSIEEKEDNKELQEEVFIPLTRAQKVDELKRLREYSEGLPPAAQYQFVTETDFQRLLLVLESILREDL